MQQRTITIVTEQGQEVRAQAPVIISASRATDIPAFYSEWFFNRLDIGYVVWRNPFNGKQSYVSFKNTRFIVFWSKNPENLLPYIPRLKELGIKCYIQFTLNDYVADALEPNVPSLDARITTFKHCVQAIGNGSVVWRFDPLILTDKITIDSLLGRITNIGDQLMGYTEKLVFSFADIESYSKVANNLRACGIDYIEWKECQMNEFAQRLSDINRNRWGYQLATCAERINLEQFGIIHNRCIDPDLMSQLSTDATLRNFLYHCTPDPGQRKMCGCILSKDIGSYNTCPHGCRYCYANTSPNSAAANYLRHKQSPKKSSIV
jgi:DNA repair photolyase